jgi:hypothetical protein
MKKGSIDPLGVAKQLGEVLSGLRCGCRCHLGFSHGHRNNLLLDEIRKEIEEKSD